MKYAIVKNGVVTNTIKADATNLPDVDGNLIELGIEAVEIGDTHDGTSFTRINPGHTTTPLELWESDMERSDKILPRWAEDLIDGVISPETQALADDKKSKRATKPTGV